jgi:hypothetical protein
MTGAGIAPARGGAGWTAERPVGRVLHLIDATAGQAALMACRATVDLQGSAAGAWDQTVCLVGGSELERLTGHYGLDGRDRVSPPLGSAPLAWRGVRAFVRARGPFDVVQTWSVESLVLSLLAVSRTVVRSAVLLQRPGEFRGRATGESWPVLMRRALRGTDVFLASQADNDAWAAAGADPRRMVVAGSACPTTAPAADRRAVRQGLGIAENDLALLPIGDPESCDARQTVFLMGLMEVADRSACVIVPAAARHVDRALRFQRLGGRPHRLIISARPIRDLVAAADLGTWAPPPGDRQPASGAAGVWIAAAHAAGVPVVAPEWACPSLYAESAAETCLGRNGTPPELARKLDELIVNRELRNRTGAALRTAAQGSAAMPLADAVVAGWDGRRTGAPRPTNGAPAPSFPRSTMPV